MPTSRPSRTLICALPIVLATLLAPPLAAQVIVAPTRIELGSALQGEVARDIVTISNFTDTSITISMDLRGGADFRHTLAPVIDLPGHRLVRDTIVYFRATLGCDTARLVIGGGIADTVVISGCAVAPPPRGRIWIDTVAAEVAVPTALRIHLENLPYPVDTISIRLLYDPLAMALDRIDPSGTIETSAPGVSTLEVYPAGRTSGVVGSLIVRGLSTAQRLNPVDIESAGSADSLFTSIELLHGRLDLSGCVTYPAEVFARAASIRSVTVSADGTIIINVSVGVGVEGTIRAIDFAGRTILTRKLRGTSTPPTVVSLWPDELPRGACLLVLEADSDRSCVFFSR